jgi:hypothetical protein
VVTIFKQSLDIIIIVRSSYHPEQFHEEENGITFFFVKDRRKALKHETKIKLLGGLGLLVGAFVLSGCTSNFCSDIDKANMAYPYEQGVTVYCDGEDATFRPNIEAKATMASRFGDR